jgi:hypothetical protein
VFEIENAPDFLTIGRISGASDAGKVELFSEESCMWLFRLAFVLLGLLALGSLVLAADADQGRRLAEMRCVPCHVVVSERQRREVSDAPPFPVIATKFKVAPDVLAFLLLHPHPRMNVPLTRREAEDLAAYISTLAK